MYAPMHVCIYVLRTYVCMSYVCMYVCLMYVCIMYVCMYGHVKCLSHLIHKTFRELAPLLASGGTGGLIELQTDPVVLNF